MNATEKSSPDAFRRALLLIAHVLAGAISSVALLSEVDLGATELYRRSGRGAVVLCFFVANWPYLVSYRSSRVAITRSRLYLILYSCVLAVCSLAGAIGVMRMQTRGSSLVVAFIGSLIQMAVLASAVKGVQALPGGGDA